MDYTYKYPRPAVTADCVVMTIEKDPQVLLIERGDDPYKGCWAIPGGFLNMDETTEQCAIRELREETGFVISKVTQIGAYSEVDRDPRGRTITVAYLALVKQTVEVKGQDDAAKAKWFSIDKLPKLAFDHEEILNDAIILYLKMKNGIPEKKDLDKMAKADVMASAMSCALAEKAEQLDDFDEGIMSLAVAKVFADFTLTACENSRNPSETIDVCLNKLATAFEIASSNKLIELNNAIIEQLKVAMHEYQMKIGSKKKELMGILPKKTKNSDIN